VSQKRRIATETEFWTAVQRLWTFEEPQNRWSRLMKSLGKVRAQSGLESEPLATQELLFAGVYGIERLPEGGLSKASQSDQAPAVRNLFFSAALALRELQIFNEQALEFCAPNLHQGLPEQRTEGLAESLLRIVCEQHQLAPLPRAFLAHRLKACPDWSRLFQSGEWATDSRALFARSILEHCQTNASSTESSTSLTGFQQFYQVFENALAQRRSSLPAGFLPNRVVLVEGATEQILLPHFARCLHAGWNERAILVHPVGGANQLTRRYPTLRSKVKIPVDCVLDGDVESQAQVMAAQVKNGDRLFILKGTIEEEFPRELIIDLTNAYYAEFGGEAIYADVTAADLIGESNQECLERLWRKRNRGTFDKIGFARVMAENVSDTAKIPSSIKELIGNLSN
jgi:hypothetical protein